ncbi:hypothetical protein CIB48_g3503 [Xylaria polymorpha]|nr:hypothetical protein CIB48_g3503 [Xylaria polymorpha]
MEGSPNVPTGTNDPNEDLVRDSNGHNQPEASSHSFNDNQFGSQSNAKTSAGHVGGGETSGSSRGDEQNQDGGSEKNATHGPGGNTAIDDSPVQPSFVTAQDSTQTDGARDAGKEQVTEENSKRELTEEDCEDELGYAFSTRKKWWILSVIFLVQTSMNFNTSLYSNGIAGISEEFRVNDQVARAGAAIFLVTYAFGCELWAPWSEEFGRKLILQLSLSLTNFWSVPVGIAPNITTILVSRALGGLSTAGGSVTLGMIADMYDSDNQQYAVAFVVFSSVLGSILGPVVGGFVELLPPKDVWRWCTWIQLIFGLAVQLLHLFTVPETRTTVMMDRIARKRRERNQDPNIYGPSEMQPFKERFTITGLGETWSRAFKMLLSEPIVRILSLLSGVSDAIVFIQIQSMNLVYKQWGFNCWQIGLAFIPIAIGYFIAWVAFIPIFRCSQRHREKNPRNEYAQFESRLRPMIFLALCLPLGLFVFAAGSTGPPLHWIVGMFGTGLIGIANYSIYLTTIDYMVCAYGPYSASATGGNGLARDLLAGLLTPAAIPFYTRAGGGRSHRQVIFPLPKPSRPNLLPTNPLPDQPVSPQPIPINERSIWEEFTNRQPRSPPRQPNFGPTSPRGAYMASVHAASRRQSRQNSRNPSANPSRRNSHERPPEAASPSGRLAEFAVLQEQLRIEEQRRQQRRLDGHPVRRVVSFSDLVTLHPGRPYDEPVYESDREELRPRRVGMGSVGARNVRAQNADTDEHPNHPEDYPHAIHNEDSAGSASTGRLLQFDRQTDRPT